MASIPTVHYAHSAGRPIPNPNWQLLRDHLEGVAKLARDFAAETGVPGLAAAANAAGWLHDLGKYQPAWQKYLLASAAGLSPKSVPHSIYGAAHAYSVGHCPLTLAIAGHHSGLLDWDGGNKIGDEHGPLHTVVRALVAVAKGECPDFPNAIPAPEFEDSDAGKRRLEFWTRVLFSTLIDADRLNSADLGRSDLRLDPGALLARMRAAPPKASDGTPARLNELRDRVFEACVLAGEGDRGFFELTVPTGGGKTRSAMAFALAHAARRDLRRVFVVIPYLSIIEQNAREYRMLFGNEVVLEHHSAVVPDGKAPPPGEPYEARHLPTENWDVPIVVTTSVQFLETLLAASTRRCRRLHNVARSVIVFDEAQCLPAHLLNALLDVFRELVSAYGCSVVFSTATQPAFRYTAHGLPRGLRDGELVPIVSATLRADLDRDLQRVTFVNRTATPWDDKTLIGELVRSPALCVLNTRRHAKEVWGLLKEAVAEESRRLGKSEAEVCEAVAGVRHLSSSLCAEHRADILGRKGDPRPDTIYARLEAGKPCWVVSTQVIEAGVDIDFPRVFRALGPLDSLVQAGGRCNREGKAKRGEVVIFRPADDGVPQGLYETATGLTLDFLNKYQDLDELVTNPAVFANYFETLYGRVATDPADIQALRADFKFAQVAKAARVIEDGGRSVIVPYRMAAKWVQRLRRKGTYDLAVMRRLQRYTVNLREYDFVQASKLGLVAPLFGHKPEGPWVLVEGSYSVDLGVVINGITPEQEIV